VDDLVEATVSTRPDEKAIVLVDLQTTTDHLLDVVRGRENLHLVTADLSYGRHGAHPRPRTSAPRAPPLDPAQPAQVSDDSLEEVQTLFELAEEDPDSKAHNGNQAPEAHRPRVETSVGRW